MTAKDTPVRPSMANGRLRKGAQPLTKVPGLEADRFNGMNVINPEHAIKGSPQQQLAQVTALLREAKESGEEAVADVKAIGAVNKGVLLSYAKANDLWQHSEHVKFEDWGAAVLEISPKYVHRLVREAAALAKVVALNERCKKVHRISRPSHAVVVSAVIEQHDEEAALKVLPRAHELAAQQNRRRPTAALFEQAARELGFPIKLISDDTDDDQPALTAPTAVVRAQQTLGRFTTALASVREKHIAAMSRADADAIRAQAEAARAQLDEYLGSIDKVYPTRAIPSSRAEVSGAQPTEAADDQTVA